MTKKMNPTEKNGSQASIHLMIASIGGSPRPIELSISTYRPERVIFFASHDTVALASKVLEALDYKPKAEFEITEDPNLLLECYRKAKNCVQRADRSGYAPEEILLDYTGGTKVMTAALLLAGIEKKYRFNYVGGEKRDKAGVGIVVNGGEKLYAEMSPWAAYAEEERRRVVTLFNRRRYAAVIEIIDGMSEKTMPFQIHSYFRFVRLLSLSFLRWDQFELKSALKNLQEGMGMLSVYMALGPDEDLIDFNRQIAVLKDRLTAILSETGNLKQAHPLVVWDLLNNARRLMEDKRNDDAAARIYRALELYGQICFRLAAGCGNDSVDPAMVPAKISDEFTRKYKDSGTGLLKLPLQATFQYLECLGHDEGIRFFSYLKEIRNIQSNRNASILAHGLTPVSDHAVKSIFQTVTEFLQFSETYDFPLLP